MEFTYKLTEPEYLLACDIVVKRRGPSWTRHLPYVYFAGLLLVVWGAIFGGMELECSDLIGVSVEIHKLPPVGLMISGSLLPAFIYAWVVSLIVRAVLRRWYLRRRLRHFHDDPGCQAETTVNFRPDSIGFRSSTGSSESIWECYETWNEKNGVLLLVTRAGTRKIVKTSGLSEAERSELRGILVAALPKT
jgi:hypothetical protein